MTAFKRDYTDDPALYDFEQSITDDDRKHSGSGGSALDRLRADPSSRLRVEVISLAGSDLYSIEDEWTALAVRAGASPYEMFGWLESWSAVYEPRGLMLVRITDPHVGPVALGLLEQLRFGGLRFAGAPITPVRGLLCAPDQEVPAWRALGQWLARYPRWSLLDAEGVTAAAHDVPGALVSTVPWFGFVLPSSFEAYLASRSAVTRREFRRRMRIAERERANTARLTDRAAIGAGLDDFLSLHTSRARAKGEVHRSIDSRLVLMLKRVAECGSPELSLFALKQEGTTLAVGVQLDHAGETWAYNTGFEPAASRLSPGLLVGLAAIRDAIERGGRSFDLGPGDWAYKRDLGGEPRDRIKVRAANGSPAASVVRIAAVSRHRLRRAATLRTTGNTLRRVRRNRMRVSRTIRRQGGANRRSTLA